MISTFCEYEYMYFKLDICEIWNRVDLKTIILYCLLKYLCILFVGVHSKNEYAHSN